MQEKFENTKVLSGSRNSKNNYNCQKRQTMVNKTLHRKL